MYSYTIIIQTIQLVTEAVFSAMSIENIKTEMIQQQWVGKWGVLVQTSANHKRDIWMARYTHGQCKRAVNSDTQGMCT